MKKLMNLKFTTLLINHIKIRIKMKMILINLNENRYDY